MTAGEQDADVVPVGGRVTWFKRYLWLHYYAFAGVSHWFARRILRPGWFVLAGCLIMLMVTLDPSTSVGYQGGIFLTVVLMISPWLTRLPRGRFAVERTLPRFASVDAEMTYPLRVRNLGRRFQRGLAVVEDLPDPRPSLADFSTIVEPGEERRNFWDRRYLYYRWRWLLGQSVRAEAKEGECEDIEPGGEVVVRMRLRPTRRGRMNLARVSFGFPDPLGLFRSLIKVDCPGEVMVLPKRYPVNALALPGSRKYQPNGVALAGHVGESEEFVSLREYRPGDPLKKIHWRSTARSARPIVKEFVDEFLVRHGLVLDTFTSRPFGEEFEEAVSVAASFACTVRDRDSLLDLLVVGPVAITFTTGRGVGKEEKMLEVLAGVQACVDRPFKELENLVMSHDLELSGCLCVLLDWDESRQRFVQRLRQRSIPVRVLVMKPAGFSEEIDPGVMADEPEHFHVIAADNTAAALATMTASRG